MSNSFLEYYSKITVMLAYKTSRMQSEVTVFIIRHYFLLVPAFTNKYNKKTHNITSKCRYRKQIDFSQMYAFLICLLSFPLEGIFTDRGIQISQESPPLYINSSLLRDHFKILYLTGRSGEFKSTICASKENLFKHVDFRNVAW